MKKREVVIVHNSRELVDENGIPLSSSYDMPFEVLIDRINFRKIIQHFPLGLGNISSYAVRREFLDEIRTNLSNIDLALDAALPYLSLEHIKLLLHILQKLTIYRVSTGISTYGKVINYSNFLENKNKVVCFFNRVLEDFRYLESSLIDCKQCMKEIQRTILYLELYLSPENEVFKCSHKSQLPSLNSLFLSSLKHWLDKSISTKDFYNITKGVLVQLILGKRRVSEIRSRKGY